MGASGHHEFFDREEAVSGSSERSFGIVIAAALLTVAAIRAWHGQSWLAWIAAAAPFAVLAALAPQLLRPLNKLWLRLGLLLHSLVSPLILGVLFFLVVTPVGWLMRLAGKRPLHLQTGRDAGTYWIQRAPPGPDPRSMKNQF
jgi:hypothetical protein